MCTLHVTVFNMSNVNYKLIVQDISKLIKENKEIILDEHYEEFLNLISFLKNFENVNWESSKNGCHFTNCCWSSNECRIGPDTCACYMLDNRIMRVKKLMLLYERLK